MNNTNNDRALDAVKNLLETMRTLRGPGGCDWDRRQSPDSLKKYIIEEAYEVIEAIDRGDPSEICEELGDLLLQIVFQAQIFQEQDLFGMAEVADSIDCKLRRRHPHIFLPTDHENSEFDWEKIKQEERTKKGQSLQLANRIPSALPALKRAAKLDSSLAHESRFSCSPSTANRRITESLERLAVPGTNKRSTEHQIGEILYQMTALARSLAVDAEEALRLAVDRRIKEEDAAVCSHRP